MSRAVNVQVFLKDGESADKLIRRFMKKCKKVDIIKEHLEKVSYARSKSRKKKDKELKNKHMRKIEALRAERKNNFRQQY